MHYANHMMKRWLSLSIVVGLVGCAGPATTIPDDDAADHFGNIPSFVLPTAPPSPVPTPPVVATDGGEDELPSPKKQKKKKKKNPTVGDGTSDSTGDTWVTPELEVDEPPVVPAPPLPPPTPPPPSVPQDPFTSIVTDALSTEIDQSDIYLGDIDATTAQRVDCPPDMVATGVSLVYDSNDIITGFQSISCRPLSNDGTLGTLTIVSQKLGSTQIPLGGSGASLGCSGKRKDGIIDGYTVRYNNEFITRFDLHCKSLQALWHRAHVAWTVRFSADNGVHEPTKSKFATMTSDMYHQSCADPDRHAIVSLHLRDNGQTDATGRLIGIGRICGLLKKYTKPPVVTSSDQQLLKYFTGLFGGPGGGKADPLVCPFDSVATGLVGRAGADIDALGLICQNRYDGTETTHGPIGGGGGAYFEHRCPASTILHGAVIVAGSWDDAYQYQHLVIKQLQIVCGRPDAPQKLLTAENTPPVGSSDVSDEGYVNVYEFMVPLDHEITGLQLRTGDRVDAMGFIYQRVPWYQGARWDFSPEKAHMTAMVGGPGGGEQLVHCPYGQIATGLAGRRGMEIDALGLVCRPLSLVQAGDESTPWSSPLYGGGGGGAFALHCPKGSVLQQITTQIAEYGSSCALCFGNNAAHHVLVGIQLGCASIVDNGDGAPLSISTDFQWPDSAATFYGYQGAWFRSLQIPSDGNHVITGLRIRSGDRVDAIGLFYHALE